ncbi:MAG TPA: hypothetical protein PLR82_08065 [Bacillota bacterium]|nr:hypothetical protein [Bacillota bacterium]HQD86816.1 hypothetical protein [Bacillota bacterium]
MAKNQIYVTFKDEYQWYMAVTGTDRKAASTLRDFNTTFIRVGDRVAVDENTVVVACESKEDDTKVYHVFGLSADESPRVIKYGTFPYTEMMTRLCKKYKIKFIPKSASYSGRNERRSSYGRQTGPVSSDVMIVLRKIEETVNKCYAILTGAEQPVAPADDQPGDVVEVSVDESETAEVEIDAEDEVPF